MADTKHHAAPAAAAGALPVEGDGVNYSGIVWFMVIIFVTTIFCQVLMWGFFALLDKRQVAADPARPAVAEPVSHTPAGPTPLLTNESGNLKQFRDLEEQSLTTYGWVDKNAGTVRIPIDKAKDLLLQRGLAVRGAAPTGEAKPTKGGKN